MNSEKNPIPADMAKVLLKLLRQSDKPLTVSQIQKNIPGPLRKDRARLVKFLDELSKNRTIGKWLPKRVPRYWGADMETYSREQLLDVLSRKPMTRLQLLDAFKRKIHGGSDKKAGELMGKLIKTLIVEKRVFQFPMPGNRRKKVFSAFPPDPSDYMGRMKKEFETVCGMLKNAGLSSDQIFLSAGKMLRASAETIFGEKAEMDTEPPDNIRKLILEKVRIVQPEAERQALVPIRELRAAANIPDRSFDAAVLELAHNQKIFLHRHIHPYRLSDQDKEELVTDGKGNYYVGLVIR